MTGRTMETHYNCGKCIKAITMPAYPNLITRVWLLSLSLFSYHHHYLIIFSCNCIHLCMTNPMRRSEPCTPRPTSRKILTNKRLDTLEDELGFLHDEWTTICVIFDSIYHAYLDQMALARMQGPNQQMLKDYDDLFTKVYQLERKVKSLEEQFESAQKIYDRQRSNKRQRLC